MSTTSLLTDTINQGQDVEIRYTVDVDAPTSEVHIYIQAPSATTATDRTGGDLTRTNNGNGTWTYSYIQTPTEGGRWYVDAELQSAVHGNDSRHGFFDVEPDPCN
ncbi:MAG: hypothetical protein KatS3mg051_1714 [Anaerolineae bacterium]|nr:MAG: hypothetical protein KatS3mg051_1714 [Anaerolineae bacterium]